MKQYVLILGMLAVAGIQATKHDDIKKAKEHTKYFINMEAKHKLAWSDLEQKHAAEKYALHRKCLEDKSEHMLKRIDSTDEDGCTDAAAMTKHLDEWVALHEQHNAEWHAMCAKHKDAVKKLETQHKAELEHFKKMHKKN